MERARVFEKLKLRERDTIPKPVGLGSLGPRSGLSVRHPSGAHPVFVQVLSGACPALAAEYID